MRWLTTNWTHMTPFQFILSLCNECDALCFIRWPTMDSIAAFPFFFWFHGFPFAHLHNQKLNINKYFQSDTNLVIDHIWFSKKKKKKRWTIFSAHYIFKHFVRLLQLSITTGSKLLASGNHISVMWCFISIVHTPPLPPSLSI